MPDVPLKCRCGEFQAILRDVSPSQSNRVSCYCIDCQTFAKHLGGDDILDEWGGTEIRQVSPAALDIVAGREHLAAVRLSPKGLVRWYTSCCNTPLGNTSQKPRMPFIGIPHVIFDADPAELDTAFGTDVGTHMSKYASGRNDELKAKETIWTAVKLAKLMGVWWMKGHLKKDPLFNGSDPVVEPTIISREERERLAESCGATSTA